MKAYTTDFFIERAKNVYGDKYDYSKTIYINTETPLTITCPNHGEFKIRPLKFLQGRECKSCKTKTTKNTYKLTTEQFVEKAQLIHGDKYDYSLVKYTDSKIKVNIICKKHGEFKQMPAMHLQGQGCPNCVNSMGENEIFYLLTKNNIKFNTQHKFDNCVHKRKLPFDFYLPQKNVCIEFQGAQHYSAYHHMGGEKAYQKLIVNDQIKKEFCKKNNITLLEIKFDENIESKLREFKII